MTQDQFIRALLTAAQEAGITAAEAYYQSEETLTVRAFEGAVDDYAVSTSGGLSLRGLVGGRMGSAYTEALDEQAVDMLVRGVLESAALITDEDEQFIFPGSPSYARLDAVGERGSAEAQIDFALSLEKIGKTLDPHVKRMGSYTGMQSVRETVRIVNTYGLDVQHVQDVCIAIAMAIATRAERTMTGMEAAFARNLADLNAEKVARAAVEEAVFMLDAAPCASGTMPVILRNGAMADLLQTFSSVFSADAAQKGLSLLAGKEHSQIAAPCVTLVDDPLLPGGFASRPFDGEGVATYTKKVIENGVLTTLLHNLKTANKAGCASTGNASRASYAASVGVSPTNFFLQPGQADLDALHAHLQNGLVVTEVSGLHAGADAVSGDFSLLSSGYLVENGRKGRPVEQITVAGNFFQLLRDIEEVGCDLRFPMGSVGSPSVRVRSLSVAGT